MLWSSRRLTPAALALATIAIAPHATAQSAGNIDLNSFRPAMDSRGYVTVNASQVLGKNEISFGLGALDWGYRLLRFEEGDNVYSVDNVITATIIAAYGMKFGPAELEVGASLPLGIMAGDRNPDSLGDPGNPNDDQRFKLEGQGLGNVGLHLKTRFLKTSRGPKIGLGVIASFYFPTAKEDAWLGDQKTVMQFTGILDKEFGRNRRFRVALNGGIRIRPEEVVFTDNDPGTSGAPTTGKTMSVGNEVPFGAAMAYALSPQRFDLVAELIGSIPLEKENYLPLEAIGALKVYLARNSFLSLGGGIGLQPDKGANPDARAFIGIVFEPAIGDRDGDGIKDDVDDCPTVPEDFDDFEDEDGCPEPDNDRDGILDKDDQCPLNPEDKDDFEDEDGCPEGNKNDRDGDGILDDVDQCPDDPEDFDEFEDEDGCPDPDNDKDGILDVDDLCPNDPEDKDGWEDEDGCPEADNDKDRIKDVDDKCPQPEKGKPLETSQETYNGTDDEDGCPDRGRVVVTDTNIAILEKIYFEYNKAIIKPESYGILNEVAATLEGNPDILQVEIQGHTDERGGDAYNLDLSDRRAKAVRTYLVEKGVDEKRLEGHGYGESQPLDRRSNEEAWAKNRRVEFLIIKRASD